MEVGKNQILLKCEICDKEYKNNKGLKNHFNIIHNLEKEYCCNICQKIFNVQGELTVHLKSIHANKKDHKCDSCKKSFSTEENSGVVYISGGSLNTFSMTLYT